MTESARKQRCYNLVALGRGDDECKEILRNSDPVVKEVLRNDYETANNLKRGRSSRSSSSSSSSKRIETRRNSDPVEKVEGEIKVGLRNDYETAGNTNRGSSSRSSSSSSSSSSSGTSSSSSSSSGKSDQDKEYHKGQSPDSDESADLYKSKQNLSTPLNREVSDDDNDIIEDTPPRFFWKIATNGDKSVYIDKEGIETCKTLSVDTNKSEVQKVNDESRERTPLNFTIPYSDSSSENVDESDQDLASQKTNPLNKNDINDFIENTPLFVQQLGATSSIESVENIPAREQKLNATPDESAFRKCNTHLNYTISPVYTDESDVDLSDDDPDYVHTINNLNKRKPRNFFVQTSDSLSSSSCDSEALTRKVRKGRKRLRDIAKWKQNKAKRLRNSGKSYVSVSKKEKMVPNRCLQPPCTQKCKLKCTEKIGTDDRYGLFTFFWGLGDLYKQRAYIKSAMVDIKPRYQYTNAENPRKPNKAYHFTVKNEKIRICKTFFKSTLDISDRMIFTTQQKTNNNAFLEEDLRGKHNNHKKMNPDLIKDIKDHINSIPRMESHYVRATTSKEYIDGGMTIKDLYNGFIEQQKQSNKEIGNYMAYYSIFTKDFNISFFQPKKDMCDLCLAYGNSTVDQKIELTENYNKHLEEKKLSREEKKTDRRNITENTKVVIYDLQAVLQCPRGDSSAFYYKSKLNSYNLTVTELTKSDTKKGAYEHVHCYFWTESDAKRGAIEIGTCVWKYLEEVSKDADDPLNVIFYSDNCAGQNKNKYIMTMYMYAVYLFNIQSITHKFLIRGHTQNEADNVHSLIEKEVKKNLKSGPIYTPVQYITLIKNSKKSNPPINVHELTFESFLDFKLLQEEWGFNFGADESGQNVNWNDIKVLKVTKENPFTFYFRTSYQEKNYKEVNVRNKRRKMKAAIEISLNKAYTQRQELSSNKKKDLKELIRKGLIPSYYASFYDSIF